jgi:transcriptional regulator with XRE-family HTH domain
MLARTKMGDKDERRRIGSRIRRRRLFLDRTQGALAAFLGVTFQQVQKYEKGSNRVPSERLRRIAEYLEVAPDYFSSPAAERADAFEQFVQSQEGVALYRAMALIGDAQIRARLILAISAFSDSQALPEEKDDGLLSAWLRQVARPDDCERNRKRIADAIHAMKAELAQLIGKTLKARKLTQTFAARILVTDQARISALASGNVEAVSFEKLLRYLVLLGWDARIAIVRRPVNARGRIELTSNGPEP